MISQRVLEELRSIAGPAYVRTDEEAIRENSTDATKVFHPADVIVFPGAAVEVSEMEVVLPTGEIVNTGGRVVKNAVGYDLTDLMCGSEGTLGIITRLTLRLLPKPETDLTLMASFAAVRPCAEAANHLIA